MYLFPTSYFPSIFYFQCIVICEERSVSGNELFVKQSFRNRCEILTGNGIQQLSIPVIKLEGSQTLTKDIQIDQIKNWRKDHWGAIKSAYQNAPFFEFYDVEIYNLIYRNHKYLIDLNLEIANFFLEIFGQKKMQFSEEKLVLETKLDYLKRFEPSRQYIQVFSDRFSFQSNLSVLDLLFCEGPMGRNFIMDTKSQKQWNY
jgi:hypothetical protein